jgi:hypothetical protein
MDLNPATRDPSAWRPLRPKIDLTEQLKIYGDEDRVELISGRSKAL